MVETSNKTIVVVNDYDYVQGGATKVAVDTANILDECGYNVVFFCGVSDPERSTLNKSIRVVASNKDDVLSGKHYFRGIYNRTAKKAFKRLLKEFDHKNTIIHIHGWTKALTASFITPAHRMGFKSVLTLHDYFTICPNGGLFNFKKCHICHIKPFSLKCQLCNCDSRNYPFKVYRNIRLFVQNKIINFPKKITKFISISDTSESLVRNKLTKIDVERIYNFVDITKKEPIKFENNKSYLYVGRVDKEKGVDSLCESFTNLDDKLLIAGSGGELESLKEKYKDHTNIKFLGWKSSEEVKEYMKTSRALIMPSLWYEGAPLTLFEASAIGLPTIVSKYCSGKEFVTNETGWIFDPLDNNDLVKIINEIEDNDIKSRRIALYDSYWKNPFSKERYISSLTHFYEELLK